MPVFNFPASGGAAARQAALDALPGDPVELQKRTLITLEAILLLLSEAYGMADGPDAYRAAVESAVS